MYKQILSVLHVEYCINLLGKRPLGWNIQAAEEMWSHSVSAMWRDVRESCLCCPPIVFYTVTVQLCLPTLNKILFCSILFLAWSASVRRLFAGTGGDYAKVIDILPVVVVSQQE